MFILLKFYFHLNLEINVVQALENILKSQFDKIL